MPDPVLEDERGETAGPPSPHDGDKFEPEPVEPGDVVGTPVN